MFAVSKGHLVKVKESFFLLSPSPFKLLVADTPDLHAAVAMAVVDDHKVRFVVSRLSAQQQVPSTSPRMGLTGESPKKVMGSTGKGMVVHGTSQYVNGTLVTQSNSDAEDLQARSKMTNGHCLREAAQKDFSAKRSNSACQLLNRPQLIPITAEAQPKTSIMKKPSTGSSPLGTSPQHSSSQPAEVRKLVTFTDLVQYEDDDDEDEDQRMPNRRVLHSEADLVNFRILHSSEKAERTKVVSRSKMISSLSAPDMNSFIKLKGIKNVNDQYNAKSFRIIPDSQLPSFKDLFEHALEYNKNDCALTTTIKNKANSAITPSLPQININLIPNPESAINPMRTNQDSTYLKVPRLKKNHSSGFIDNSTSFKVFDRVLADGSLEIFCSDQSHTESPVTGDSSCLPELDVQVIKDEENLMEFWNCVEKWQSVYREEKTNRAGLENVLYLNKLRNELLLQDSKNR